MPMQVHSPGTAYSPTRWKRYISKALRNPTGDHLELFFNMIHKNKLQDSNQINDSLPELSKEIHTSSLSNTLENSGKWANNLSQDED
jgi:hypothetical protein